MEERLTSHHHVGPGEMREARGTNLAPIGTVRTVGHEIDTHLTLRRLDSAVGLARRDRVTLAEQLLKLSVESLGIRLLQDLP